jgi:pyrroline-5-carboxylate reductase
MDAVTGLSGSGPAFVYMIIEDLAKGGCRMGLPKEEAIRLASQTVMGAAAAVIKTGKLPHELREMVVSPGGTTIEGLKVLEEKKVSHALQGAVVAAAKKSRILSQKWAS